MSYGSDGREKEAALGKKVASCGAKQRPEDKEEDQVTVGIAGRRVARKEFKKETRIARIQEAKRGVETGRAEPASRRGRIQRIAARLQGGGGHIPLPIQIPHSDRASWICVGLQPQNRRRTRPFK